jgi:threonine synthase
MGRAFLLVCSRCERQYTPDEQINLCECGGPLLARYDFTSIQKSWHKTDLISAPVSMWRYAPVLPLNADEAVTLDEGWTPLLKADRLGRDLDTPDLWIKEEGRNPTGSFKARGLCCAIGMAKKAGAAKVAIPSAGNAAGALAAYAAKAGLEAHVFMPGDVPQSNYLECKAHGARVTLVDGMISDCARIVADRKQSEGWFDMSTLKEPYRIEGKKTMGYEIAEQFAWQLPDAILYPCGGGVGLIGIWKAFEELEQLGWIGNKRPKMIAVQATGCAPIVRAFEQQRDQSEMWQHAHTAASGLRVPKPLGDALVLKAVRASGGVAMAVSDEQMIDAALLLAELEGIFAAPEGGACVAAARYLRKTGFLTRKERIVILNTGSGFKYAEAFGTRFARRTATEQDKLGGLITPR